MKDSYYLFYAVLLSSCVYNAVFECHQDSDFQLDASSDAIDSPSEIIQFWIKNNGRDAEAHEELIVRRSVGDVTLRRKRSSVLRYKTPVYLVHELDFLQKLEDNIISDVVKLYEEPSLFSTVAHTLNDYGHPYFTGSLAGKTITRISNRTARSLREEIPHLFAQTLEPGSVDKPGRFILSDYYALHTPKLPENGTIVLPPLGNPNFFKKEQNFHYKESYKRLKRSAANTVYPEILLVLDYDQKYTSVYEFRFLKLIMYSIAFWNSVNLRFRALKNPEVQLRLIGIIVSTDRNALSFVKDNIELGQLDASKSNRGLRFWAVGNFNSSSYDIAVMQTNIKLFTITPTGEKKKVRGMAFQGITCFDNTPGWRVGVFYDQMDFSGVNTAVHELGHILGAAHDTATSPDICLNTENYIMTDRGINKNTLEWSQCSKDDIELMLRLSMGDCLDNDNPISDQGELIDVKILPGRRVSLKEQCIKRGYVRNCNAQPGCNSLNCRYWSPFSCSGTGPALDGTPCEGGESRGIIFVVRDMVDSIVNVMKSIPRMKMLYEKEFSL